MRRAIIGLALLGLTACGGNDVPSPSERLSGDDTDPGMFSEELIALRGDGLSVGGESFFFAAGQTEVETALTDLLGAPTGSMEMTECGAGRITQTKFPGGLTVNFESGSLVGWFVDEEAANISASQNIAVGTPRPVIEAALGFSPIEGSTLGEEFSYGQGLGGLIEDDTVALLYAGKQCFFR